jgi:L,D-transpeptidase YcbB
MRIHLLFLVTALLSGAAFAQVSDPVAVALQTDVEALNAGNTDVLGTPVAWPQLINEFYARRSFKPAWTNPKVTSELRRALEDSRLDGLDPADYHLQALQSLATESAAPKATAEVRAKYELLQTDAFVRLAYHLSFGKVDPTTFDAQWNYVRTLAYLNVAKEIEATLSDGNVYERLNKLRPTHRLYVSLKRELAHYRDIEAKGGWPTIPTGATIKPGASDPRVTALRHRLAASGDLDANANTQSTEYDAALQEAVKRFQASVGLPNDGAIGARTIEEMNVPIAGRIRQMRVNMDRGRVLLNQLPNEFVVVNIAGYQIYFVRGSDIVWQSRVQVGKPYRRTPIFRSELSYLVWNPTWTVPPGIIKNDILPAAKKDPKSIERKGLEVLDASGQTIDPSSIDWSQYRSGIPYTLRQPPGPKNALGRVKFMFPNPYLVYLHDTPSRSLFDSADRSFSSGCVRVERPTELALLLLKDPANWNEKTVADVIATERTTNVNLPEKIPVLLTYWTAWVDSEDQLNFRRDVYGQDAQWAKGLDRPFTVRKQPLFDGSPDEP